MENRKIVLHIKFYSDVGSLICNEKTLKIKKIEGNDNIMGRKILQGLTPIIGGSGGDGLTPEQLQKLNNAIDKTTFNSHVDNKNNPHETSISKLKDVLLTSLLDKQSLVYNSTTGVWENGSVTITESGKIKLNPTTALDYLENYIDNNTIQVVNNKLVVKTLDGLTLTVTEINDLKNKLGTIASAGMTYKGTVPTKADLDAITSASSGDTKIVLADETQSGKRMTYVFNGTTWDSLGEFSVQIRDFTINPIDLSTEVTGKLSQANMDLNGLVKTTDLADYMKVADYDSNDNGIVDKAETLDGLTKTVKELNESLSIDDIIAGNNVELTKDTTANTITIDLSSNAINLKSLPTFSKQ